MILVDTSVWADHLRRSDQAMSVLLNRGQVLMHPFVLGELALGNLPERERTLTDLADLPQVTPASHEEVLHLIESHRLFGTGIGHVDAHLITAVRLNSGTSLWTRDKRLAVVADRLSADRIVPS